jgi:Phosphotransferase enzyme family
MSESIIEALPAPDLVSLEKLEIVDDASDSDEGTVVDADTFTTEISRRKRGESVSRGRSESNTGAQKGLLAPELEYLKDQDEGEDNLVLDIHETFFRNHYSTIQPPERWLSAEEFLAKEDESGIPTNFGIFLKGLPARVSAIEAEATRLRDIPAHLNTLVFNRGSWNIVLKVEFEDEVTWICRILVPEIIAKFTDKERVANHETQVKAMDSQIGVMEYVTNYTKIPAPRLHGWDTSTDNCAGAPYMFMDMVEGMSITQWLEEYTLTESRATHFYNNLAAVMWEFYQIRFDKIGEVQFENGVPVIGGFFDSRTRSTYGPFNSAYEFLRHRCQRLWEFRVLAERRSTPVMGLKAHWDDLSQPEREIFIAWLYREVAQFAQAEYEAAYTNQPRETEVLDCILFHADLSTNNILVDEDLNITAVIDWDWPSSLPKSCFDPLPLDVGYEIHQFPGTGGPMDHDVFDQKELFYSIWEALVNEKDPEGKFGRSMVPARISQVESIGTALNRYAWMHCIDRYGEWALEKLKLYQGQHLTWEDLIEKCRTDWIQTRGSNPGWWEAIKRMLGWSG